MRHFCGPAAADVAAAAGASAQPWVSHTTDSSCKTHPSSCERLSTDSRELRNVVISWFYNPAAYTYETLGVYLKRALGQTTVESLYELI